MSDPGTVRLDRVNLNYGNLPVLVDVSFEIPAGQFLSIIGPTGCGKSTILNLVAGLLTPTDGRVATGANQVLGINRACSYMFQFDALLPWKSVIDNVSLGPTLRGVPRREALDEATSWLHRVGLGGLEKRYQHELSGGQRKRAAMAQTLINGLPILLMDEPFSGLDVQTRTLMEAELLALSQDMNVTVIFVTHDLEEAIVLSDRVLLMSAGPSSTIKVDQPVSLPRPRDVVNARFIPGFEAIYEKLWNELRSEVLATYERTRHGGTTHDL